MRFDHLKSLYLSAGVFFILLAAGFLLSQHKLLWRDEIFTQQSAIDTHSYSDLLTSSIPDGNKNPLFYIIQKAVCDISSFHLPAAYSKDRIIIRDLPSQIILRIPSDFYMSLALALIVYFFARFISVFAALYALSVALVSPMVWMYWVEARPYSLWFLLTTVQLLLFCCTVISPQIKTLKSLCWTHILLVFTTPASMVQIFIVTMMLLFKKKCSKTQLGLMAALPIGIALFYYFIDSQFKIKTYLFSSNFFDVAMPEHLFVYVMYAMAGWVLPQKQKEFFRHRFFLPVFLLFLASEFVILFTDLFVQNSQSGFFSRYLIYMVPVDIIMFALASVDLRQWSRQNAWICMNMSILLGGLVIMRGLITYRDVLASAIYLHAGG